MLERQKAVLLAKIDLETYQKYVYNNQGQSTIYVKLKKALYGMLKAAILFWKKLSEFKRIQIHNQSI